MVESGERHFSKVGGIRTHEDRFINTKMSRTFRGQTKPFDKRPRRPRIAVHESWSLSPGPRPLISGRPPNGEEADPRVPAGRRARPGQFARQLAPGEPGNGRCAQVHGLRLQIRMKAQLPRAFALPAA